MSDPRDSSQARLLAVLDLFNDQRLFWTPDDISAALGVSRPTGYRYVRHLTEFGLLQRVHDGQVTLGPRIIVLDHYIRHADPVLQVGVPFMRELVALSGFDCVITCLMGDQVLDTHREYSSAPASLTYDRGRPRPLFLGAAPKLILAHLPTPQLRRLTQGREDELARAGLPTEWAELRRYFGGIRKAGHYLSTGELEAQLGALAVPLLHRNGEVLGALALVTSVQRMAMMDTQRMTPLLQRAARDIAERLT